MKIFNTQEGQIYYRDEGQGETILLLHGYPQNHKAWRFQIDEFSKNYRVIAPDWLGWGKSRGQYNLDTSYPIELDRLVAFIEHLNCGQINIFAHDYGGFLATGLAIKHPKLVKRLALLNTRAHSRFSSLFYWQTAIMSYLSRSPCTIPLMRAFPWYAYHNRKLQTHIVRGCFDQQLLDDYIDWMKTKAGSIHFQQFYAHYRVNVRPELSNNLSSISCPTAIIWGAKDPYCPLRIAEELAQGIPQARLEVIEDGDHFIMEEHPDRVSHFLSILLKREA